ncbi:hypothetical protein HELRODRAFT_171548 [Helobdella robusta]|uniref:Uncharacterized protein n=1 Tax=Helobdella robusta TaxID=6412 RepID=T1F4E4_HELRO|nr:hypothetical protein HELRODRAFT_171548 [Helobdella robusta]ESO05204.1 hypothetical protein HELRODRAFT_171548 [Helobdella robusta]
MPWMVGARLSIKAFECYPVQEFGRMITSFWFTTATKTTKSSRASMYVAEKQTTQQVDTNSLRFEPGHRQRTHNSELILETNNKFSTIFFGNFILGEDSRAFRTRVEVEIRVTISEYMCEKWPLKKNPAPTLA